MFYLTIVSFDTNWLTFKLDWSYYKDTFTFTYVFIY